MTDKLFFFLLCSKNIGHVEYCQIYHILFYGYIFHRAVFLTDLLSIHWDSKNRFNQNVFVVAYIAIRSISPYIHFTRFFK